MSSSEEKSVVAALRRLQHEQEERRHHEDLGDAKLRNEPQNGGRVRVAHQHALHAAIEADQSPAAAADVKERHADQIDVLVVPIAELASARPAARSGDWRG